MSVDRIACDGRGLCAAVLPERIALDEWGFPVLDPRPVDRATALIDSPHLTGLKTLHLTDLNNGIKQRLPADVEERLRRRYGAALKFTYGVLVPKVVLSRTLSSGTAAIVVAQRPGRDPTGQAA